MAITTGIEAALKPVVLTPLPSLPLLDFLYGEMDWENASGYHPFCCDN